MSLRRRPADVPGSLGGGGKGRSLAFRVLAITLAVLFFVMFTALGTWQVERRAWKLDLIARVEHRVHAPATPAPGPAHWPSVTAASDEYRHVTAKGTFLDASQTLVQAVTDLGAGYWVLTPLRAGDGSIVLVNRGFIAADDRNRVRPAAVPGSESSASSTDQGGAAPEPTSEVTGLLRITEPGGAFLRHNNPAANHWFSRDVQAIAAARGLKNVAPYFIDAEVAWYDANSAATTPEATSREGAAPHSPGVAAATVAPTPGLTVIHFHNSHLVYAITWYTLALMTATLIPMGMRKK